MLRHHETNDKEFRTDEKMISSHFASSREVCEELQPEVNMAISRDALARDVNKGV